MSLPKDLANHFVLANWLHGHSDQVIEITVASFLGTDPLDPIEQMLARLPGVYRIARITGGSFGRKRELRRQVRALMAVTEPALQAEPLGRGNWCTRSWCALPGVEVYDPRHRAEGEAER